LCSNCLLGAISETILHSKSVIFKILSLSKPMYCHEILISDEHIQIKRLQVMNTGLSFTSSVFWICKHDVQHKQTMKTQ
jgi:hypothetical protein